MEASTAMIPGVALGIAIHVLIAKATGRLFRGGNSENGYPSIYYVHCALNQAVVLPLFIYNAWLSRPSGSINEYVSTPVGTLFAEGHVYEQWFLCALIGVQAKDMFPPPPNSPASMLIHHVITAAVSLLAMFGPGGVVFVYGAFFLELGSLSFNLYSLNNTSLAVQILYQVVMLISNLAASGGMVWAYLDQTVSPAYMTIYLVCGTLVCAGRQRHAFVELGKFLWPPAMRKKVV